MRSFFLKIVMIFYCLTSCKTQIIISADNYKGIYRIENTKISFEDNNNINKKSKLRGELFLEHDNIKYSKRNYIYSDDDTSFQTYDTFYLYKEVPYIIDKDIFFENFKTQKIVFLYEKKNKEIIEKNYVFDYHRKRHYLSYKKSKLEKNDTIITKIQDALCDSSYSCQLLEPISRKIYIKKIINEFVVQIPVVAILENDTSFYTQKSIEPNFYEFKSDDIKGRYSLIMNDTSMYMNLYFNNKIVKLSYTFQNGKVNYVYESYINGTLTQKISEILKYNRKILKENIVLTPFFWEGDLRFERWYLFVKNGLVVW